MVKTKENSLLSECRSCKSTNIKVKLKKDRFPLYIWPLEKTESTPLKNIYVYICEDCGHIQLQEMTKKNLSEIYRDVAYNIENKSEKISRLELVNKSKPNRFKEKKILEIGGGRNSFLKILPKSCKKWVVDFKVDKEIKDLSDGFYEGNFDEIKITQSNFDYVCMFHVLEHLNKPASVLSKIKKILNENGKILIEVPNFEWESKHRPDYTFFHMHISLFTSKSLVNLLEKNGFKCEKFYKKDEVLLAEFSFSKKIKFKNNYDNSLKYLNIANESIKKCELKLRKIFKKINKGNTAIFGGGGSSTLFLQNFPFLLDRIKFAIDNDINKIGKYICDQKIEIVGSKKLKEKKIKNLIILNNDHSKLFSKNEINLIKVTEFYE